MTRFARAKGSKACNEREPENSTPWEVMKDQLMNAKKESEDSKKREEAEKQRIENYEKFLKDHKSSKRKATWEEFPDTAVNNTTVKEKQGALSKKKAKGDANVNANVNLTNNSEPQGITDATPELRKNKKKNKKNTKNESGKNQEGNEVVEQVNSKDKCKNLSNSDNMQAMKQNNIETLVTKNPTNKLSNQQNQDKPQKKKRNKKLGGDGKPLRRKEIDDNSFQIIIHGREVELVRFDGFPVMKKDAERLEDLKNSMIKKGIPKSEVQRTMKLERRRAEKALARVKREVCYNCRKGGHVLSDCPDLKSKIPGVDAADGVCFKCGSTEHKQFECKVQRDKEFRFATCFICKEPGHIARQCPDNPKGLYPNGGSCKLCGDVTHLRKDCPTANTQKEETSFKLQTLENSTNLEGIEQKNIVSVATETTKKPKKVKF